MWAPVAWSKLSPTNHWLDFSFFFLVLPLLLLNFFAHFPSESIQLCNFCIRYFKHILCVDAAETWRVFSLRSTVWTPARAELQRPHLCWDPSSHMRTGLVPWPCARWEAVCSSSRPLQTAVFVWLASVTRLFASLARYKYCFYITPWFTWHLARTQDAIRSCQLFKFIYYEKAYIL